MAGVDIREVKEQGRRPRGALRQRALRLHADRARRDEIRESAEYCLTHAKPGGGYVFCTSNCVFRGMPLASYDFIHSIWMERRDY